MSHFLSFADLRRVESTALAAGLPLMERAGQIAAETILRWQPEIKRVLVLIGPGNNGGDGLVCAKHLREAGLVVTICRLGESADFTACELIVDALFGIGLNRNLDPATKELIAAANACGKPILALDTPSGLDPYTGAIHGDAIRADITLTFIADKPGLHTGAGCDCAGEVRLATLGLDPHRFPVASGELTIDAPTFLQKLRRPRNTHKGQFGCIGIFGGASGMLGAPLLAGRAALKLGAGKVRLGFLAANHPVLDPIQPELMLHSATELLAMPDVSHLLIGPGLGLSDAARQLLAQLLPDPRPLLLDADALNLIAHDAGLQTMLAERNTPAVLTPHPAEAARLLDCDTRTIQSNRIATAHTLAHTFNAVVLLKGAGTVCCSQNTWSINGSGNAALSNAGQGDALAGMLAALQAQGLDAYEAAQAAAWLHGAAADEWRQSHPGAIGLSASEATDLVRRLLNRSLG